MCYRKDGNTKLYYLSPTKWAQGRKATLSFRFTHTKSFLKNKQSGSCLTQQKQTCHILKTTENWIPELPFCGRKSMGSTIPRPPSPVCYSTILLPTLRFLFFPLLCSLAPTALTQVWFHPKQIYVVDLPRPSYFLSVFHVGPIFHTTVNQSLQSTVPLPICKSNCNWSTSRTDYIFPNEKLHLLFHTIHWLRQISRLF